MIVWGGEDSFGVLNTGGRYDPATNSWTATSTTNAPTARIFQTAIWSGTWMVVWGGEDSFGILNTGGRYDPVTDSWVATSLINPPEGRYLQTAVWSDSEMIVWGGYNINGQPLNTGGRYCVGAPAPTPTPTATATPTATHTPSPTATATATFTPTPTATHTPTPTATATFTPTPTATFTPTPTATSTPTPTPTTVTINVRTKPAGLTFSVDGTTYSSQQQFTWVAGSSHTLVTTSPQSGSTGVQYVWRKWNDHGAISHIVAPTTNQNYTATFIKQYYLTMTAGTGGAVLPASGWRNAGQSVTIKARADTGFTFAGWSGTGTGSYTGPNNPASIIMGGPISETGNFSP
jgi:hypothetical protein